MKQRLTKLRDRVANFAAGTVSKIDRGAWIQPAVLVTVGFLLPAVAHAQVVSGGTSPTTIIDNIATFILGPFGEGVAVLAVAAVGFMCWTGRMGFHAIGWLAAGLVLVFGSSYLVTTFVGGG
ncbi:TrbC/VirB2 family protein [Acidiphilium cryptum]|uniref:VIRB2 type IV secretion fmaily protein n=1 Tax=Acidiphilium cryptum (strain JF-5) TaxID=349163 RepID=A5FU39_ACICJ|nr:TrbC/VirB2 family protein [Acidiphilium cryptum]ABQ29121.1 VIRB2 type IV secretion fmaily protein [Acidiphilium cryptum JF-5]UBU63992.1 TrbC/VirB2 family protein [Acidithiobacillus ferrooxidans]